MGRPGTKWPPMKAVACIDVVGASEAMLNVVEANMSDDARDSRRYPSVPSRVETLRKNMPSLEL